MRKNSEQISKGFPQVTQNPPVTPVPLAVTHIQCDRVPSFLKDYTKFQINISRFAILLLKQSRKLNQYFLL